MKENNMSNEHAGIMIIIFFVGALFGFGIGSLNTETNMKQEAIQHQAAHYDTRTGAFTWNNEKSSEDK